MCFFPSSFSTLELSHFISKGQVTAPKVLFSSSSDTVVHVRRNQSHKLTAPLSIRGAREQQASHLTAAPHHKHGSYT